MNELLSSRVPFSAIVDRPKLILPDSARMVVWLIVNIEHWSMESPMPRTVLSPPMGQPLQPDLPNWAWHEYGMRVGFWRIFDALNDVLTRQRGTGGTPPPAEQAAERLRACGGPHFRSGM